MDALSALPVVVPALANSAHDVCSAVAINPNKACVRANDEFFRKQRKEKPVRS